MTVRETERWTGIAAVAFVAVGVGVITREPGLLLAAIPGIAYLTYARSGRPLVVDITLEREFSDPTPQPGDDVEVTVRITNEGGLLPDLRTVDGVPDGLGVTDGSPRFGTALRAGRTAEYTYTVTAERGDHIFEPATVIVRDAAGTYERETTVGSETTLTCRPQLQESPLEVSLRPQTTQFAGPVATDAGGSGLEFHATREYRRGDPLARIDWNRKARTGELTTVEFREERSATVVLLIDAREDGYVGTDRHALEHNVAAAGQVFASLLDDGHRVGLAGLSEPACWLSPGTGTHHREAARELLATHPGLTPTPPERPVIVTRRLRELQRRLPETAQVFLFSPLADDYSVTLAGRLEALGHAVSVVTPDVTLTDSPGRRLAAAERRARIGRLRAARMPVVTWRPSLKAGAAAPGTYDEGLLRAFAAAAAGQR